MSGLVVIIPVKSSGKKSRLSPVLDEGERRSLSEALLGRVLGALARAGLIGATRVVSSDAPALELAAKAGAVPVPEGADAGVNSAVRAGMSASPEADDYLVLPSDLPLLRGSDVLELVRLRHLGMRVVVSPSAPFDGTNALLFPAAPRFPLSFDRDSFWNHLAAAARLEVPVGVCARKGIMFDVDSPEDLRALSASGFRGAKEGRSGAGR